MQTIDLMTSVQVDYLLCSLDESQVCSFPRSEDMTSQRQVAQIPAVLFWNAKGREVEDPPEKGRFIVAIVSQDGVEKRIFRTMEGYGDELLLADYLMKELGVSTEHEIKGGGLLRTDKKNQVLAITGRSKCYGHFDFTTLLGFLESELPHWIINAVPS